MVPDTGSLRQPLERAKVGSHPGLPGYFGRVRSVCPVRHFCEIRMISGYALVSYREISGMHRYPTAIFPGMPGMLTQARRVYPGIAPPNTRVMRVRPGMAPWLLQCRVASSKPGNIQLLQKRGMPGKPGMERPKHPVCPDITSGTSLILGRHTFKHRLLLGMPSMPVSKYPGMPGHRTLRIPVPGAYPTLTTLGNPRNVQVLIKSLFFFTYCRIIPIYDTGTAKTYNQV